MTVLCSICARGGSTGVPGKNIRTLQGKPLIVHSIEQALAHDGIDHVVVSTDDPRIAEVARTAGAEVPFLRPDELATASAPKIPVIEHLVDWWEKAGRDVSTIIDLDPTSPLRTLDDISACLALLDADTDAVITGYPSDKNPYFNMVELDATGQARLVKSPDGQVAGRQFAPKVYAMNASIYVWHRHSLSLGLWNGRTKLHIMPRERSIDIDTEIDFKLVELLMTERGQSHA